MSKLMKLSEIKISPSFVITTPREEKMEECRNNYISYGKQDRYIVVDHTNTLIDGYIMYLVLKENNVDEAKIKISNRRKKRWKRINTKDRTIPHYRTEMTTYVYGVHTNSKSTKERVWRVPDSWSGWEDNLFPGDSILVKTKRGMAPVVITKIEQLENCPINIPVKKAWKKLYREL